jgi:hypothetical protein
LHTLFFEKNVNHKAFVYYVISSIFVEINDEECLVLLKNIK